MIESVEFVTAIEHALIRGIPEDAVGAWRPNADESLDG